MALFQIGEVALLVLAHLPGLVEIDIGPQAHLLVLVREAAVGVELVEKSLEIDVVVMRVLAESGSRVPSRRAELSYTLK